MALSAREGLISPRDRHCPTDGEWLYARNEVTLMESSLVEFSLDNRSIDEVRRVVSLWRFSCAPHSPSYQGRVVRSTCSRG
jgi:hypothetical protein